MLIDWILKNIMDMDKEDQSGKTQWTKYYLTVYFSGLFNFLMILILSVLFGTLSETFIVYVVLIFLRPVAGGWHAKTKWLCRLESIVIYVAIPFVLKNFSVSLPFIYKILLICLLVVLLYWYAPQGTAIEPVQQSDLKVLKKQSLIRVCLLILCSLFVKEKVASVILYGLVIQGLMILPVTKNLIEGTVFMKFGKKIIKNVIEKRVEKVSDGVGTKPRLNQNSPNIFGQWMGQTEKPKKNIEK